VCVCVCVCVCVQCAPMTEHGDTFVMVLIIALRG
jgi:low affinity Fe/Cu permease